MSLGFAVMLSYASFLHRRSDINNNALIIGLGDLGTSLRQQRPVTEILGEAMGPTLLLTLSAYGLQLLLVIGSAVVMATRRGKPQG